jgi:hypothetical protein
VAAVRLPYRLLGKHPGAREAAAVGRPVTAYEEALQIQQEHPGTVCVQERHYTHNRHSEPYRMGYGPHRGHWHTSYEALKECDRES